MRNEFKIGLAVIPLVSVQVVDGEVYISQFSCVWRDCVPVAISEKFNHLYVRERSDSFAMNREVRAKVSR